MEESSKSILESRQELMISPSPNANPTLRLAHFLKPSIDSNFEPISTLSSLPLPSLPSTFDPRNWPLTVNFNGWRNPPKRWKEWVHKMASMHAPTWKKAGIYEAIFNSTYRFYKNDELLLGVAEKWCPDTKSFIFPWGEATITLEDMMIAGYSVLGFPVFEPLETEESMAIEEALIRERREIIRTSAKKALQCKWLKIFMDSGSEIEHEAFLSLWLSRFVFPTSLDVICECVFPVAIHLARGTRIALAPAVLATMYRDLNLVKEKIVFLTSLDVGSENEEKVVLTTWAPFQLVLVWVWERFVKLHPEPNLIKNGEPRFSRWDNLYCNSETVRLVLDSSKESFSWRPYTKIVENWNMPKFYIEKEMWVSPDSGLDEEILSFIQCLRVSELVGLELDCIEQYLPQRVAKQFGFDQDLPGFVARCSASREDAWDWYIRPITGAECYIPSYLFEADVTTRYLEWWNHSVSVQQQEKTSEMTPKVLEEKEKEQEIFRGCHTSLKSFKRKRALSELNGLKVSAKSSERTKSGKTSKTFTRKKAAGKLNGLQVPAKSSESMEKGETSKSPTRKNADGELNELKVSAKSSERRKKGETSKSPIRKKAASELNGLKVSAESSEKMKKCETTKSPTSKKAAGKPKELNVSAKSSKRVKEVETISSFKKTAKTTKEKVAADVEHVNPCLPSQSSDLLQQIVKRKASGEASVTHVNAAKKSKISAESNKPAATFVEINDLPVPPGFPSKYDTVKAGDPTADDNITIAQMIKHKNKHKVTANKQCAGGKNLASKYNSHLCPVAGNEFAETSVVAISGLRGRQNEAIENGKDGDSKTAFSQSHSYSSSPAGNEYLKGHYEEKSKQSVASESKQTCSNGNASDISHQSGSHSSTNERSLNVLDPVESTEKAKHGKADDTGRKAAAELGGFQSHVESEPLKNLEPAPLVETVLLSKATEYVENVGQGDSVSSANNKTQKVAKAAMSPENVKLSEAAEEVQDIDIEDTPRELDQSESHSSSVAGNETPKDTELPEKVILVETESLMQNNCSVGNVAHSGNDGSRKYLIDAPKLMVLEDRIKKLEKVMAARKAVVFRNICGE